MSITWQNNEFFAFNIFPNFAWYHKKKRSSSHICTHAVPSCHLSKTRFTILNQASHTNPWLILTNHMPWFSPLIAHHLSYTMSL